MFRYQSVANFVIPLHVCSLLLLDIIRQYPVCRVSPCGAFYPVNGVGQ